MQHNDILNCRDIVKKMKLLDEARETLLHFTSTDWNFPSDNFKQLENHMTEKDRQLFPCRLDNVTEEELLSGTYKGWECLRKYKLKENVDDLNKARKRMNLLKIREVVLHVFMYFLFGSVFWLSIKLVCFGIKLF